MEDRRGASCLAKSVSGSSEPGSRNQMTGDHSTNARPHTSVASTPRLSSEVRTFLGRRLRAAYDSLVREPVPERFLKLLERLEATTEKTS
jgi:hypothetical protein